MSLRDELVSIIRQMRPATERADLILAIPAIAEALKLKAYCATSETVAVDGDTGIDTGPGSGNTPEDQRRDVK